MKLYSIRNVDIGIDIYDNEIYQETINDQDANWDRCPKCESTQIDFDHDTDIDSYFYYRTHLCLNCHTMWEERYDMVQIKITEGNTEIIEKNNNEIQ
jgi:hypothetical protein